MFFTFGLIFCKFQPGVAYKSVAYEKRRLLKLKSQFIFVGPANYNWNF